MSGSGIQFSNNDDSGILQGNQEWVAKWFEIVEALPVHDKLQTATPKKGRDNSSQGQGSAGKGQSRQQWTVNEGAKPYK